MAEQDIKAGKPRIIVIKKRSKGHGGHHGGAWKVAYADFVTAMMALFIVLWLMSADDDVKKAISAFFNNPSGPGALTGTAAAGTGNAIEIKQEDMKKLQDKIKQSLMQVPHFENLKDNVEITITSDGLRIELLETEAGMFFASGKPAPTNTGADLLEKLADEIGKLPNKIMIEGHTDSKPFPGVDYSNWELSVDRANAARKLMQNNGLRGDQVVQVRGYADRHLRHPEDPGNASNRRISVIVQYDVPKPDPAAAAKAGEKPGEKAGEKPAAGEKKGSAEKPAAEKPAHEEKPSPAKKPGK